MSEASGDPRGPVRASTTFARRGHPWVSAWPPRLLQAALSVLGYVEADKENGESLWVAPSVPAVPGPGDTPSLLQSLGQSRERPRTHVVPPVPRLVPRVQGSRNYRDPALWELPGCVQGCGRDTPSAVMGPRAEAGPRVG